jgi:hypothetical protein
MPVQAIFRINEQAPTGSAELGFAFRSCQSSQCKPVALAPLRPSSPNFTGLRGGVQLALGLRELLFKMFATSFHSADHSTPATAAIRVDENRKPAE